MTTVDPRTIEYRATYTRNDYYDLVSVLYHALEGARTHSIYRQDASTYGDEELAQFFEQCQQNDILRAERAKELMATRAGQHVSRGQSDQAQANQRENPDNQARMDQRENPNNQARMDQRENPNDQVQADQRSASDEPERDESKQDEPRQDPWLGRTFDE